MIFTHIHKPTGKPCSIVSTHANGVVVITWGQEEPQQRVHSSDLASLVGGPLEPPPKEDAPSLVMRTSWCFILGKRDSLLVLKALGGRLTDAEAEQAHALGDRLTQLRAQEGRDYLGSLERAEAASLKP